MLRQVEKSLLTLIRNIEHAAKKIDEKGMQVKKDGILQAARVLFLALYASQQGLLRLQQDMLGAGIDSELLEEPVDFPQPPQPIPEHSSPVGDPPPAGLAQELAF